MQRRTLLATVGATVALPLSSVAAIAETPLATPLDLLEAWRLGPHSPNVITQAHFDEDRVHVFFADGRFMTLSRDDGKYVAKLLQHQMRWAEWSI